MCSAKPLEAQRSNWLTLDSSPSSLLFGSWCLELLQKISFFSKSIRKANVEKHNLFGRGRLLQERPRHEAGDIQCCQEMLADSPTNLQIGLTPDIPCVAKIRRPQWHVPKSVKRIFRALTPEPDPLESSGYVLKGMEDKLRLEIQQVCRPDECKLWPKIRSPRKHCVERAERRRPSVVSA